VAEPGPGKSVLKLGHNTFSPDALALIVRSAEGLLLKDALRPSFPTTCISAPLSASPPFSMNLASPGSCRRFPLSPSEGERAGVKG